MNRELTFAEKTRLHDKFLVQRWINRKMGDHPHEMAEADFRDALQRWKNGENVEIPPPAKWPDSCPRRWTPDEIAATRQDPKRAREYLVILYKARCQVMREAIVAGRREGGVAD